MSDESESRDPLPVDRVTLEIKGAKLTASVQSVLRRKRQVDNISNSRTNGNPKAIDGESSRGGASDGGEVCKENSAGFPPSAVEEELEPSKDVALLKATVDNLRTRLREKEDAVTELEREREGLLESTARLEAKSKESQRLSESVATLKEQLAQVKSQFSQAKAGRTLTMTLVETLKSSQDDLRDAHRQLGQRCTDLETVAEDATEAARRGDLLLQNQRLKIHAQSRQLKRQDEELKTLRREKEESLATADQKAAELAQVQRREKEAEVRILDAQSEVEELKGDIETLRQASMRDRELVRKNQEVIEAHVKALQDARAGHLSISLEAEKQSMRHQQAMADLHSTHLSVVGGKEALARELAAKEVETGDLKARLEEALHRLDKSAISEDKHMQESCETHPSSSRSSSPTPMARSPLRNAAMAVRPSTSEGEGGVTPCSKIALEGEQQGNRCTDPDGREKSNPKDDDHVGSQGREEGPRAAADEGAGRGNKTIWDGGPPAFPEDMSSTFSTRKRPPLESGSVSPSSGTQLQYKRHGKRPISTVHTPQDSLPPRSRRSSANSRPTQTRDQHRPGFAQLQSSRLAAPEKDVRDSTDVCPSCGEAPYGLMLICRNCSRQHHSSCAPERGEGFGNGFDGGFLCPSCNA